MNQEMPKSPFDLLAEHYGPNGTGFDPDNLFTKALYIEHKGRLPAYDCRSLGECSVIRWAEQYDEESDCHGTGYVRRSRAEVALLLPGAATQDRNGVTISGYSSWEVVLVGGAKGRAVGRADNWLDALAAAILAKEGVKADA